MQNFRAHAALAALTGLCLLGSSSAKALSEPIQIAANAQAPGPVALGTASDLAIDVNPTLDTPQTYRANVVDGFDKIARLDLQLLCDHFPLNSRCQGIEKPVDAAPAVKSDADAASPVVEEKEGATSGFAVVPTVGTLGIGLMLDKSITPHLNARLSGNYFEYRSNNTYREIRYDATTRLQNAMLAGDYYPWKNGGFHLSLGVAYNGNRITGTANTVGGSININGVNYSASDVGDIKAKISYPTPVAPYIGIGWGNPVARNSRLSFYINAGILVTGTPKANFTAMPDPTLPRATQDQIISNVKADEQKLQKTLNNIPVYPVLTLGFSYQF
jgi:hypothetical protein